jgi:fumarate reductase subunit D
MNMRFAGISLTAITILVLLLVLFCLPDIALADAGRTEEHVITLSFSFIKPLGISALSLVLITFGTGLFRRKLSRRFIKIHRVCAWSATGLALCHGILVLTFF